MEEDYYEILGVPEGASKEDIKRAYHILAHQYHPDKNNGNEFRFKKINEAYRILHDDGSRFEYDRMRGQNKNYNTIKNMDGKNIFEKIGRNNKNIIIFIIVVVFLISLSNKINNNNETTVTEIGTNVSDQTNWTNIQLGADTISYNNISISNSIINYGKKVNDSKWGIFNYTTTEGGFMDVGLKLNNNDVNSAFSYIKNIKLTDQQGRNYFPVSMLNCNGLKGNLISENYIFIKPDIPCTVHLLFEVSENSESFYLNFQIR